MMANYFIQTYASMKRIEKYLEEEEVPAWVSWRSPARLGNSNPSAPFDERIGFVNASFEWTSPNKEEEKKAPTVGWTARVKNVFSPKGKMIVNAEVATEEQEMPFKLRNIDIMFAIGGINLISGPTGSGKSSCTSCSDLDCFKCH